MVPFGIGGTHEYRAYCKFCNTAVTFTAGVHKGILGIGNHKFLPKSINAKLGSAGYLYPVRSGGGKAYTIPYQIAPQTAASCNNHCIINPWNHILKGRYLLKVRYLLKARCLIKA